MTLLQNQALRSSNSINHMRDPLTCGVNYSNRSLGFSCREAIFTSSTLKEQLSEWHLFLSINVTRRLLSCSVSTPRSEPLCDVVCQVILPHSRKLIAFLPRRSKTLARLTLCPFALKEVNPSLDAQISLAVSSKRSYIILQIQLSVISSLVASPKLSTTKKTTFKPLVRTCDINQGSILKPWHTGMFLGQWLGGSISWLHLLVSWQAIA